MNENDNYRYTLWDRIADLPWFGIGIILGALALFSGIGFGIYLHMDSYRNECHDAGGHVVVVKDVEICVDHDNRVIFL